ncbi:MAG: hypothetical protein IJP52_02790 [Paludibacteraceae bacterium]|nr:hypothetical protein [Paludibacteraceae bacterium]
MKKIFALALALVSTISMFAAINSQFTLYLETDTKEVYAEMAAGNSYSPFNAASCASYAAELGNASNIGLYVQYQGGNYMALYAPEFVNVPVVVVTSREAAAKQNYEFFVEFGASHVEDVYLTDLRPDGGGAPVTINLNTITGVDGYSFTLQNEANYVEGENCVIADRFVLNYNPAAFVTSVTTNADGWASFAYTADVAPAYPAGLTAYKGALNTTDPDNMVVDLTEVTAIPAGAGVFVHGAANTTYYFSAAASAPALTDNQIVGCTIATDPADITDAIYTLRNVGGTTALYQYVGTEAIPAGKAYLPIAISAGAPARIAIRVAQPTDVREVEATVKAEKFMEDGKIYIRRGDNIYNLQGQKVN